MRLPLTIGFTMLLLLMAACTSVGGSGEDVSEALNIGTEPVLVAAALDQANASSARIGPNGGTLTTIGSDGSQFLLDIPAGALLEEIEIGMTPMTSLEGLPLGAGLSAGVVLEPEGTRFLEFATLTIVPGEALAAGEAIPIGSSSDSGALYIPLIDAATDSFRLKLLHFSSAGLAKGLTADLEPVRQRLGGDIETRLESLANAEIAHARQTGEANPNANPELMAALEYLDKQYREYVIKPRIAAAGESCAAGRLAIETVVSYGQRRALLGMEEVGFKEMSDLMPTMTRVCLQEEYELCRDDHIVHRMLPALRALDGQRQAMGILTPEMDQIIAEGEDLTVKCLRFELEFESRAAFPDSGVSSDVEAKVNIQYESGSMVPPSGTAALDNTGFTFEIPGGGCTANATPGGGAFSAVSLNWLTAVDGKDDPVGHVEDILLRYDPGQTTEAVTLTCPFGATMGGMDASGWWSRFYFGTHAGEAADAGPVAGDTGGIGLPDLSSLMSVTYLATGWEIQGGELFAELEWERSVEGITEEGTFRLYHRPE